MLHNKLTSYTLIFAIGACIGFSLSQSGMEKKIEWLKAQHSQQVLKHIQQIKQQEQNLLKATQGIDQTHYKELENAQTEINRLRHQLHNGTVRLQQPNIAVCNHSPTSPYSSVDTNRQTQPSGHTSQLAEDVLQLAEHASTAINQRNACIDILKAERNILSETTTEQGNPNE